MTYFLNIFFIRLQLINILCNMLSDVQSKTVKNECLVPLMQTLLSLMLSVKLQETNEKCIFNNVLQNLLEVADINDSYLKVIIILYEAVYNNFPLFCPVSILYMGRGEIK